MDFGDIRASAEALEEARALALLPSLTGRTATVDLAAAYEAHRAAWEPEAFGLAWSAAAGKDERLRKLAAWCAAALEAGRGRRADQERLVFEALAVARRGNEETPWREALSRIPDEPRRELRGELEQAAHDALQEVRPAAHRRVEAALEAARELGFGDYATAFAAVEGFDPRALAGEAEALLADTDAAYADVLAWAFARRGEVRALPGGDAARHDLEALLRLPELDHVFRPGRGWDAVGRWMQMTDLDPYVEGLTLDATPSPTRALGAIDLPVCIPGRVHFLWRRGGGAREYLAFLGAFGGVLHRALTSRELPFEDRWAGDDSVHEGHRALFGGLVLDPQWRARVLDAAVEPDTTRLLALCELCRLRQASARLIHELALYTEGPRANVTTLYKETMERATRVRWPEEHWMVSFAPRLRTARELRGAALAALLLPALRERFDEDWWRNPVWADWLPRILATGQRDAPEEVARRVARQEKAPALELALAGRRLVRLLAEERE